MSRQIPRTTAIASAVVLSCCFAGVPVAAADDPASPAAGERPAHPSHPAMELKQGAEAQPAKPGMQPSPAAAQASSSPTRILIDLHHANQKEIQLGQQAKEKAQSSEVRNYAETLIQDHREADQKVEQLADKMNVELTPPQKDVHELPVGPNFDQRFAEMMIEDHKKDIQKMRQAREKVNDPQVKELIGDVLPKLEKHLDEAQDIAGQT